MLEATIYSCGVYEEYECTIKRKYSQDRAPVVLPDVFTVLLVPSKMTDEQRESLSTVLRLNGSTDKR